MRRERAAPWLLAAGMLGAALGFAGPTGSAQPADSATQQRPEAAPKKRQAAPKPRPKAAPKRKAKPTPKPRSQS
jgi:hypothetical protein